MPFPLTAAQIEVIRRVAERVGASQSVALGHSPVEGVGEDMVDQINEPSVEQGAEPIAEVPQKRSLGAMILNTFMYLFIWLWNLLFGK